MRPVASRGNVYPGTYPEPVATDQPARFFVAVPRLAAPRSADSPSRPPALTLTTVDWIHIVVAITVSLLPAIGLAEPTGSRTPAVLTFGRSAPSWLVGASMVAMESSTATPNIVADLVRTTSGARMPWPLFPRIWRSSSASIAARR